MRDLLENLRNINEDEATSQETTAPAVMEEIVGFLAGGSGNIPMSFSLQSKRKEDDGLVYEFVGEGMSIEVKIKEANRD
jgi:hypothetical protein